MRLSASENRLVKVGQSIRANKPILKTFMSFLAAIGLFIMSVVALPSVLPWALRATVGVTGGTILLWVLEPVPMAVTSLMSVIALPILQVLPLEMALKGYSNNSTFLIMAGFMIAQGVNSTSLGKRFAILIIDKFGGSLKRVLLGILLAPQLLSMIIPATAVRTTLLLPAILAIVSAAGLAGNSNTTKILVLGLSFGASISGVGFIPAAISNVLTVDLLKTVLGEQIYFFTWLKITWPVWLLMLPVTWWILPKVFPPEKMDLDTQYLNQEIKELGSITWQEKKCLIILSLTVILWMTESIHKLPIAIPAVLAVVLMALPGIGITDWNTLKNIDWGSVLLMGASLSLASAINESGAAEYFATQLLNIPGLEYGLSMPILAVLLLSVLTHIYHLGVSNVSTVVLTLTPVVLQLALKLGVNPLLAAMTINLSALFGFLLNVETLPGVITYATGTYKAQDLLKVGFWLTIASIVVVFITALLWWPLIGLTRNSN